MSINRRTVIAALPFAAAAPLVATVAIAAPAQSPLVALIDAHKASSKASARAADRFNDKEEAYLALVKADGGRPLVFKSLGGASELIGDGSTVKESIAADFFKQRERLAPLEKIAPDRASA